MAFSLLNRRHLPLSKNFVSLPILLLVGMAFLATGCHPAVTDPNDPKYIVAEKGTWKITRADLNAELATLLKQRGMTIAQIPPAQMPKVEMDVLKSMILKKTLLEKAAAIKVPDIDKQEADALNHLKERFPSPAEFEAKLKATGMTVDDLKKHIHEDVMIHALLAAEADKDIEPTPQETNDFYLKNKQYFVNKAQVRVSRVLVMTNDKTTPAEKAAKKKAIDKAHDRVAHGEDFAKVAGEVSEDQGSKGMGGDLGFFTEGQNEPQFDAVAFHTKVGTLSPVFETSAGYQFLKVTDSHPAGDVPTAQALSVVADYLRKKKRDDKENAYLEGLMNDKSIIYHIAVVEPPPAPPMPNMPAGAPQPPPPPATPSPAPAPAPSAAQPPQPQTSTNAHP